MTIIHITNTLGGGGAEQMVLQLAKRSTTQYKTLVIVLCAPGASNVLDNLFKENAIEYHYLNINSFRSKSLLKGLKKLHSLIKSLPSVTFHCHQFHGVWLGMLYKIRYKKIPIVFTLHTNKVKSISRRILLSFSKPLRFYDIIFSENAKKWYLKNNAIIPNGIDFKSFSKTPEKQYIPASNTDFNFLFLGRLSTPKNPLFLVTLAKALLEKNKLNFKIHIVGEGVLKKDLLELISNENLEDVFVFHGFQKDIQPYLSQAHCMILPSIREGLPLVIIEAAAAKLPILSTPVGSIPDYLNATNGYLSTLEAFPETANKIILNYSDAQERAQKLYDDVKHIFSLEDVYNTHLNLYTSSIK